MTVKNEGVVDRIIDAACLDSMCASNSVAITSGDEIEYGARGGTTTPTSRTAVAYPVNGSAPVQNAVSITGKEGMMEEGQSHSPANAWKPPAMNPNYREKKTKVGTSKMDRNRAVSPGVVAVTSAAPGTIPQPAITPSGPTQAVAVTAPASPAPVAAQLSPVPFIQNARVDAAPTTAIVASSPNQIVPYNATQIQPQQQQQPPFQQQQNQQQLMIVQQQKPMSNFVDPNVPQKYQFGRTVAGCVCPHCKRQTVTSVRDHIGVGTVVAIIIMAFIFFPLCWLPLCIPMCKRTSHYCGHAECGQKINTTPVMA